MGDLTQPRFLPSQSSRDLMFVSGQIPRVDGQLLAKGQLGESVTLEVGRECARLCARNVLGVIEQSCGSLDGVAQVLKLTVFVASTPSFDQHPDVADAASDMFVEALGERGEHARAAVGVASLPLGVPVEVEAVIALRPDK
jgi:enamine deaminase RidA (YjgF/YER057c/UK114 family)